jgi:hypothetical protein
MKLKSRPSLLFLTLALIVACAAQLFSQSSRPPLSAPKDAVLHNGKWYAVILDKMDWPRAKAKCEGMGGRLAVAHREETWKFIKDLTKVSVWLGATDEKIEGEWVWVDGTKMGFTSWGSGQPDNVGGTEHYLSTWRGDWNDAPKNWDFSKESPVVGYICEWDAK